MNPRSRIGSPAPFLGVLVALVLAGGLGLQACERVTVVAVEVASLVVLPATATVDPGEALQLSVELRDAEGRALPERSVAWSSLDPQVASVDGSGRVTALVAGTARIRATSDHLAATATLVVASPPRLAVDPAAVAFEVGAGSGPTPARSVAVTNAGGGTLAGLELVVDYGAGPSGWLEAILSGGTAPATLTLRAFPAALSGGRYTASVQVHAPGASASPATVTVSFEVAEGAPEVALSPEAASFASSEGEGPPAGQWVEVTNAGGGTLSGLRSDVTYEGAPGGWLAASLEATTAPTRLHLGVDPAGLVPGDYEARVRVLAEGATGPAGEGAQMTVRFRFGDPPPRIGFSPGGLSRTLEEGTVLAGPVPVQVTNLGSGTLTGLTVSTESVGPSGWLSPALDRGTAPTVLRVGFDPAGRLPGIYRATLFVDADDAVNAPAPFEVEMRVVPRPVAGTSTLEVVPDTLRADGASLATVTVTLRDARGVPLGFGGDAVEILTSAGTLSAVIDLEDGRYRATLRAPTQAGPARVTARLRGVSLADTAEVRFIPGPLSLAASEITASPTRIPADGASTAVVTVRLLDAFRNLVGEGGDAVALATTAGTLSAVTDLGDGRYTATLTSSAAADTAVVTGTVNGAALAARATVAFSGGGADAGTSTVTAEPPQMTTDGSSTVTVQLRDAAGNPLDTGGDAVFLSTTQGTLAPASGTTGAGGRFEAVLTASTPGTATITAYLGASAADPVIGTAGVTVTVGALSAEGSTLVADPTQINPNQTSTLTVQLRDAAGNPLFLDDEDIFLTTTGGTLDEDEGETDEQGRFSTVLSVAPADVGTVTVTAYLGDDESDAVIGMVGVTVTTAGADAGTSTLTSESNAITTDGSATLTVQLRDAAGDPLVAGGDTVFLASTFGTLTPERGTTQAGGRFEAEFTARTTGTATLTAYLGASATAPVIGTAGVTVTVGALSAEGSTLVADPTRINHNQTTTLTVQLRDAAGNPLSLDDEDIFLTTTGGSLDEDEGETDDQGRFTTTLRVARADVGIVTVTAYLGDDDGDALIGTVDVTVIGPGGGG